MRVTHMCRLHTTKFIIRHFLFTTSCSQYDHDHMQYVYTPCASHIYFISHMLCMLDSILLSYFRPTSQHMNYFFEIPSASKCAAHLYMLCESQTTGYMRARFDRLIPSTRALWWKARQMDGGRKTTLLSGDSHLDFPFFSFGQNIPT